MSQRKIIGIAGAFGSGKSTAASVLQDLGYHKISLGQFLEEELTKQGDTAITRHKLQELGNQWREKYGSDILVKKALEFIKVHNWDKVVIEGYRNSEEIKTLRREREVILISLVANRVIRYRRLKKIARREVLTKDIFDKLDDRDLGIGEGPKGLQTAICVAMADIFLENNGTLKGLRTKIKKIVKENE